MVSLVLPILSFFVVGRKNDTDVLFLSNNEILYVMCVYMVILYDENYIPYAFTRKEKIFPTEIVNGKKDPRRVFSSNYAVLKEIVLYM